MAEGFHVITAATPDQARDALMNKSVDLAVLDIRLADDDDENDITGLEVATDRVFRFIPKIMLTGFPISYERLREAYGFGLSDLPPTVAFVDKSEGPNILLKVIRDAFERWPQIRKSTLKISDIINYDHNNAREQARVNFRIALSISLFGFLVIIAAIFLAWFNELAIGIVGTTSGVILEALGYLFFKRLDLANARMDYYHREMLQPHWLELILAICDELPAKKQEIYAERAIAAAIDSWLTPLPRDKIINKPMEQADSRKTND
jgi:Response regulator containing CheY-like receiver, AAA-type ATPase, and DNA-binding domains